MMGHKVKGHHDVRTEDVECLRDLYLSSGMSRKQKTKETKIAALTEISRNWGLKPEEILKPEVFA